MRTLFTLLALSTLLGCESSAPVVDSISSGFDSVVQNGQQVTKATTQELEKLYNVEYKVVEISHTDSSAIEAKLATLGQDRWECFFIEPVNGGNRFYFKRSPKTLLRYIPRVFY